MKWIGWRVLGALIIAVLIITVLNAQDDGPDMSKIFAPPGHLYEVAPDGEYILVPRDQITGGAR